MSPIEQFNNKDNSKDQSVCSFKNAREGTRSIFYEDDDEISTPWKNSKNAIEEQ